MQTHTASSKSISFFIATFLPITITDRSLNKTTNSVHKFGTVKHRSCQNTSYDHEGEKKIFNGGKI